MHPHPQQQHQMLFGLPATAAGRVPHLQREGSQRLPSQSQNSNLMVKRGGKVHGGHSVLKLPPTAVCNGVTGDWEETDPHRLAQRRKQLCFGKVTEGYINYTNKVAKEERQEGNEMHPNTPRLNQVCSKRSWDCQVGKWRRSLHYWDANPSPEKMRKCPEELRAARQFQQPRLIMNPAAFQQQSIKVKYIVQGNGHCMIIMTPLQTTYNSFLLRLEAKVGTVLALYYRDEDNDVIDVDDDVSLRAFLDTVAASTPPPKLVVEASTSERLDVSNALRVLARKLPFQELHRLSQRFDIDLTLANASPPPAPSQPHSRTPPRLPELMDITTPTPDGKTPAMNVYNAMWTPESECRERRKLFA